MANVYGYCRVSTLRQAGDGDSLELQQRQIDGYCRMHGFDLTAVVVEEGVSGAVPVVERSMGGELFRSLRSGDIVIAAKLDRLFRSALDALRIVEDMKKRGVRLHMLDLGGDISGNGLSRLFLTIAAAFAEAERDRIRERVSQSKADQKARGRYLGGPRPFGYAVKPDGFLEPLQAEQDAIAMMFDMRASGATLRTIAVAVRDQGLSVTAPTVNHVLKRGSLLPS